MQAAVLISEDQATKKLSKARCKLRRLMRKKWVSYSSVGLRRRPQQNCPAEAKGRHLHGQAHRQACLQEPFPALEGHILAAKEDV